MNKAIGIFNRIIAFCLFVAALVVIAVSSVTTIYYDMHYDEDWPQYGRENIPVLILLLCVVLGAFLVIYKKNLFENYRIFWTIGLVFICSYCLMLILAIHPQAVNDSKTLDDIINSFMAGDYSSLTDKGGYLFIWPFQLGYVLFGQWMHMFFGPSNYFAWDMVQLFSVLVTVFLIYRITWEIFEDRTVCGIVGLLSLGALFFYNYVTYIYGDILSMAPQTLALYMMILFVKREKARYGLACGLCIAFAIMIKTNCEITLIALIMVLIGSAFTKAHTAKETISRLAIRAAIMVFMLLAVGVTDKAVDSYFCNLTGLERIPDGNPAFAHIAMGLQESDLEDGWYNGYNYEVFEANDYDTEATGAAALENIKETLSDFARRPLHGARFLTRKFTTQWADSVCISTHNLDLVSRHVENQPPLCDFLVFGQGSQILIWVMNVYMPVCYIGVAICLFGILRGRKTSAAEMLLLILIFGGIVFHEFWEGSSRYTMRYYIYYLPYGAYGIKCLLSFVMGRLKKAAVVNDTGRK
jgi:4-amino-4-deoxy-L-arabinose transferase-like glycosyltransferase